MHPIWTPDSTRPGVSDAAIADWSTRQKRELPAALLTILRQHNGGTLKQFHSNFDLSPLADIKPVNTKYLEDIWQMHETMEEWREELEENEIPPKTKLYPFLRKGNEFYWLAWLDGGNEPRVISRHWDDDGFHVWQESVDEWCVRKLAPVPAAQPGVVWEETRELDVIFTEKCILGTWVKGEQVLGRKDGGLWLYTHEIWERGGVLERESYAKKRIPEPLDQSKCDITKEVANWCLPLKPAGAGGCEEWESRRSHDSGGWIDAHTNDIGTRQIYSTDREKIEAVRFQLFGPRAAVKADRKARRESQMPAGYDAMAERLQAGLEKVRSMPCDDPARGELLQTLHKQMTEAAIVLAGTMEPVLSEDF